MIKNNFFLIEDLRNVVFIGESKRFKELIKINKKLNISSNIITCPNQNEIIDINIDKNVFDELDENFEAFIDKNFDISKTLFISLGSRWIFSKKLIEKIFGGNIINFHGTRLPYDAGPGGGMSWRIMRGDRIDNQLVHLIDECVDTGAILFHDKSLIPHRCQLPIEIEEYRLEKFIKFYEKFIKKLKDGYNYKLLHQPNYLGRHNIRLDTMTSGWIDWNMKSINLIKFINAFDDPYMGASSEITSKKHGRLFIKKAQLHGGESSNHPFMSGLISRHDKDWIVVSTIDENMILIEEVLNEEGKNIIALLKPGDRFFSTNNKLEAAKNVKISYGPKGLN
tara:strand:- start:34 stop:1044 length:1011 start_codon:yes stop_codon:yes gene_type:complete